MTSSLRADVDVDLLKARIRASSNDVQDDLKRNNEFFGTAATMSPRVGKYSHRPHGTPSAGDRPTEWLGTPSGNKSYTVKDNMLMNIAPPSLDDTVHEESGDKSQNKATGGVTHHTVGASSLGHPPKSGPPCSTPSVVNECKESPKAVKSPFEHTQKKPPSTIAKPPYSESTPVGVTRHTLGASSSHHQSSFATEDGKPDPEKYKTTIRESIHGDGAMRSPEFLGGSSHHRSSPSPSPSAQKKVFGKFDSSSSISPMRPTQWLTSKSSATTPTSAAGRSFSPKPLPPMEFPMPTLRDKAENPRIPRAQSVTSSGLSRHANTPNRTRPTNAGDCSPYMTPKERVDPKRFVAAFAAFEQSPLPLPMAPILGRGISPSPSAKRNFIIDDAAKRKEAALIDSLNDLILTDRIDETRYVMENLRKVAIPSLEGMTDDEKRDWIGKEIDSEGAMQKIFNDMLEKGLIGSNLGPNRLEMIRSAIEKLERLLTKATGNDYEILEDALRKNLRKLTTTSSGAVDTIQQAIARLRKVRSRDIVFREGLDDIIVELRAVIKSMQEGQVAQFFQVFEEMERSSRTEAVAQPESKLTSDTEMTEAERARLAKARFSPQNANFLVQALAMLKSLKMNKRQLALIAAYIRQMKYVESKEDARKADEAIQKLVRRIGSDRRSDISSALQGLGKLRLNDHERADLAELVRGFGRGRVYRNEIVEAIMKLKKIQMTPTQAKEAAGIMFTLRKVQKNGYDIRTSRELKSLRSVMTPEQTEVVAEVFTDLCKVDLSDPEMDQITGAVAELGVEALEPTDYQLITMEYIDGTSTMVLNIPDGGDYASEIESMEIINFIKTKEALASRVFRFWIELDDDEPESEEDTNHYDSDVEVASDDEGRAKPKTRQKEAASTSVPEGANNDTVAVEAASTLRSEEVAKSDKTDIEVVAKSDKSDMAEERSAKTESKGPPTGLKTHSAESVARFGTSAEAPSPSSKTKATTLSSKDGVDAYENVSPTTAEMEKKIRFTKKPHWVHKKHHTTVVSEKRWRFEENFNVDEVVWSPLSREQFDRRKKVDTAILKTMDKFASVDDVLLDTFDRDDDRGKSRDK